MPGQAQPQLPGPRLDRRDEQGSCSSSSLSLFLPFSPLSLCFCKCSSCRTSRRGWPYLRLLASPRTAALIAHTVHFKYLCLHGKRLYVF